MILNPSFHTADSFYTYCGGCVIMLKKSGKFGEWIEIILVALVISLLIENYLFGFAVVQGKSMEPTINNNDRLLVVKFAYKYKEPQVGDLVIFNPPSSKRKNELFIKRIVASENDYFTIREGTLLVNDEERVENYIFQEDYIERIYPYVQGVVPDETVFVMGDNRNDSNDSRNFGFVDKKSIKGKVICRIWPLNEIRTFVGGS